MTKVISQVFTRARVKSPERAPKVRPYDWRMNNIMEYILEILKHLLVTEIVELAIAYLIGIREKNNLIIILIINVITNITLNLLLIFVVSRQVLYLSGNTGIDIFIWYYIIVVALEIIIIFVEAFVYYKMIKLSINCIFYKTKDRFALYLLISLILNVSSILVGRLLD